MNVVLYDLISYTVFAVAITILVWPLVNRLIKGPVRWVAAPDLNRMIREGQDPLVLDIRRKGEFQGRFGHIPGALNMPMGELSEKLDSLANELDSYKTTPVVVVCRTANRAYNAAKILEKRGFTQVSVLRGGMIRWVRSKLPVEYGA